MKSVVQTFKDTERWLSSLSSNETNLFIQGKSDSFPSSNLFPVPGKIQLVVREKKGYSKSSSNAQLCPTVCDPMDPMVLWELSSNSCSNLMFNIHRRICVTQT